ncbi:MAG: host attachment protein [Verrucomicrobiales bacterium]
MKKYPCCIVVADGSRARVFSRSAWNQPVVLTDSHDNPAARQKTRELLTDGPGKTQTSDPLSTPGEIEEDRFAKRLAAQLTRSVHHGEFEDMVLVASPRFLGSLRAELPRSARERIVLELPKNWTAFSPAQIQQQLDDLHPIRGAAAAA